MNGKYILKDGVPVVENDLLKWARWFEEVDNRKVEKTEIVTEKESILISTIFLGFDHSFGVGNPLLYETMIFGGKHDQYQERYATLAEAQEGHKKAVELVKKDLDK